MSSLRSELWDLLALPDHIPAPETLAHASFMLPEGDGPFPAILYCHAHGGDYALGRRELTEGARWLAAPPGPDLVDAGFAVLCIDMPGFGARQSEGSENALAKAGFWRGKPLFGQMVADQLAAFEWLTRHPRIDRNRIATMGTSMGGALAMWTAALDPRVAACAQLCILADIEPLMAANVTDRHGLYFSIPGFLNHAEMGDIAGLIAPRPQFIGHGETDGLTPAKARDAALNRARARYDDSPALETFLAPDSGHTETPEMRRAMLDFLSRHLAPATQKTRETC